MATGRLSGSIPQKLTPDGLMFDRVQDSSRSARPVSPFQPYRYWSMVA